MATTISMDDVRRKHTGYFFERGATRFFRSRYPQTAYQGIGGTFFVTSEQFVGSNGVAAPRRYTVRRQDADGGISSAGKFNEMTQYQAHKAARELADTEPATVQV